MKPIFQWMLMSAVFSAAAITLSTWLTVMKFRLCRTVWSISSRSLALSLGISTVSMPSDTSRIAKKLPASRSSAPVSAQCVLNTKSLLAT